MCHNNPDASGPFVLFADDEEDVLKLLCAYASSYGIRGDTARTPDEILEKVNQHCEREHSCYDVLVIDVHYGTAGFSEGVRKTGILALNEIRKKFRNLPVLVLTAFSAPITRENVKGLDAEVVQKPFEPDELMRRILYLAEFARSYEGEERRKAHMNRSSNRRRRSDEPLAFPNVITEALAQVSAGEKSR
jgi:DNA-binding response OmpR family regulator